MVVAIDEADNMLSLGFEPQLKALRRALLPTKAAAAAAAAAGAWGARRAAGAWVAIAKCSAVAAVGQPNR